MISFNHMIFKSKGSLPVGYAIIYNMDTISTDATTNQRLLTNTGTTIQKTMHIRSFNPLTFQYKCAQFFYCNIFKLTIFI